MDALDCHINGEPERPTMATDPLTRTLILTIALPDFYAEDLTKEHADKYFDGDMDAAAYEAMSSISNTARLLVLHDARDGDTLMDSRAVILDRCVCSRLPDHDQPEDGRLAGAIEDWKEWP